MSAHGYIRGVIDEDLAAASATGSFGVLEVLKFRRAFPAMALWMVVIISNLSNSICKVAENKNAIVQRLLDVIHKPFQAAVNRSAIWLAKRHNDNPCVDRVQ